jgi:hypothetical protein
MKLASYLIGTVLCCLFIFGFYTVANQEKGIWDAYDYTPPSNNMSSFDRVDEINTKTKSIYDDLRSLRTGSPADFIKRMVSASYNGIIVILDTLSIPLDLVQDIARELQIPTVFVDALTTILIIGIIMTAIYLIFLRSDSG